MAFSIDTFLNLWDVGELEQGEGTDKLSYRVISGHKYQFRAIGYRDRTSLLLDIMAIVKDLAPVISDARKLDDSEDEEAEIMALIPSALGVFARPEVQTLLERLNSCVWVDIGKGGFSPLSDELVSSQVFLDDVTLQVPVALTVVQINLGSVFNKLKGIVG